jgi:hypothetical protein
MFRGATRGERKKFPKTGSSAIHGRRRDLFLFLISFSSISQLTASVFCLQFRVQGRAASLFFRFGFSMHKSAQLAVKPKGARRHAPVRRVFHHHFSSPRLNFKLASVSGLRWLEANIWR